MRLLDMEDQMRTSFFLALIAIGTAVAVQQTNPNPRQQPGASITIFVPDQHDLYDGHFVLSANRIHIVGGLNDPRAGTIWTTRRRTPGRSPEPPRSTLTI